MVNSKTIAVNRDSKEILMYNSF